ncbi:MAG: hypothetical protein K0Q50_10 [Vampirovibrio sp.]|jgi:hypothetical protein|nr:hypothetical protein [Vampirovibrio sp.]
MASPDSSKVESSSNATPSKRKKMSQERMMIMFTLFFLLGILILVLVPEGHFMRGIAMTIYSVVMFWAMFRYGL